MIIPTAEFDPMFADDGRSFRAKMTDYIEREFGDLLGADRALLKSDAGLERLAAVITGRIEGAASQRAA